MFDEAAGEHAVKAPDEATSKHGKPASMLSDRGTQFYATESEKNQGGFHVREAPERLGHTAHTGRGGPPPDQRQLERARGEMQRKLRLFHDVAGRPGICPVNPTRIKTDSVARFVRWHNTERPHMSVNADVEETPEMAFERKTPPPGSDAADEYWASEPAGDIQ